MFIHLKAILFLLLKSVRKILKKISYNFTFKKCYGTKQRIKCMSTIVYPKIIKFQFEIEIDYTYGIIILFIKYLAMIFRGFYF